MLPNHSPRMPRNGLLLGMALLATLALSGAAGAKWVDLGGGPLDVTLIESDGARSIIEITLGGFEATPVTIDSETYYEIALEGTSVQQEKGFPALPDVRRSVIIPDDQEMSITLLSSTYVDLPGMPIAPSKGHLPRSINPETVPYTFGQFYQTDTVYPPSVVEAHDPYILRDFRGIVADANAFQYMNDGQTLRVYTHMRLEVTPVGPGMINVLDRPGHPETMDPQFVKLYEHHFLNYDNKRYDPVLEDGGLLIITYDAFLPNVEPLYLWKMQKGLLTKLVTLSETGSTSGQILSYIQNEYNTGWLGYVLLVGDAPQLPTIDYSSGSDPSYSLLAGGDSYPDIFVGRLSAENPSQVDTQVQRTITYERDAPAGVVWPQYGCGIASNQGPGHHGEYDDEHEDLIREKLLAYGYIHVDQIYDPYGTSTMVTNAMNEGRGIVNYTGHGSTTSWGSTGFSNSHVNALVNDNMLPFIVSVACYNGNFTSATCFAEAWLRATHDDQPTGAIAAYMSTAGQSWSPPMDMQDEAVDLLVADEMRTIGGLWFNGSCLMIDLNGGQGEHEFKCWTIFGDPSLAVRTKAPEEMAVSHTGTLFLGQDEYDVHIPGVEGALCALYNEEVIYGTALTNGAGMATISLDPLPPEPMNLTLTVTAYNKVTYVGDVEVIPAEGPYLLIDEVVYIDSGGDGLVNAGETVDMLVKLRNVGIETAANVNAEITDCTELIDLIVAFQTYPDIPPGGEAWCDAPYSFGVAPHCPDGHTELMPLLIYGEERLTWNAQISFVVHAPDISVESIEIDDTIGGDGNYRLDPGETATVAITLLNAGSGRLDDITGIFTCSHPQVTILAGTGTHAGLGEGESGLLEPIFEVSVDPAFAAFAADFGLQVTGTNSYDHLFEIPLPIGGFYETVEQGSPGWTHYFATAGFNDEWHISTQRNHTPNGTHSWKCGDTGFGSYGNLLDAALETPAVTIAGECELLFWMWIDAEESGSYPGRAYDGGLVEVSIDGGPFEQITPVGDYTHTIRIGSTP
ncbi:MAG: hypothetical protein KAY24_10970, partial [Candidatus Eisenbacteria sp.]|nr:hypothetical protein [Candidatus Eisenbacteria bacterium]